MEQEGWADLPADLLALIFQALPRLAADGQDWPSDGTITVKTAGELLAACSPCRHWRSTALARVRPQEGIAVSAETEQCTNGSSGLL